MSIPVLNATWTTLAEPIEKKHAINAALSGSLGFGGINAALALKAWQ